MKAEIVRRSFLSMQVCVPWDWSDAQVLDFVEEEEPSGTIGGWRIRREGDEALSGDPERVQCATRSGCAHIMLDA